MNTNISIILLFVLLLVFGCSDRYGMTEPEYDTEEQEKNVPWSSLVGKIAYTVDLSWEGGSSNNVYLLDARAKKLRMLVKVNWSSVSFALSPDGDSLAFSSYDRLYVNHVDSINAAYYDYPRYVFPYPINSVSWQGSKGIFSTTYNPELQRCVLYRNGTSFSAIPAQITSHVSWTLDEKTAVVCISDSFSNGSLYRFTVDDSALVPLLQPSRSDSIFYYDPAISSDGTTVVFAQGKTESYSYGVSHREGNSLWLLNIDGTGLKKLIQLPDYPYCSSPSWSPDGENMVYNVGNEIRLISKNGTNQRYVCKGMHPSWSK